MYINLATHYIPEEIVPNEFFTQNNPAITDEWITTRTGIKERRRAAADENSHTMAQKVAQQLLIQLPYPKEEIDLVVGGTYTPYDTVATVAHAVQNTLGKDHIPCISVSSACSTLLNSIEIAEGYFASGKAQRALIVVADKNTAFSNIEDVKSAPLWGDGAVALSLSQERLSDQDLEIIELTTGGAANVGKALEGVVLRPLHGGIHLPNGRDVFIHAIQYMTQVSLELMEKHGFSIGDLKALIPHQANLRISKKVAEDMNLPLEKVWSNIEYLGNTGAAGCGIALSEHWQEIERDDLLCVSVFGGGYSYGAMLLKK